MADEETTEDEEAPTVGDVDPAIAEIESVFDDNLAFIRQADEWCAAAPLIEDGFDQIENVDFSNTGALEAVYTGAFSLLLEIQPLAPSEIEDDVAQTVAGFESLLGAFVDAEWNVFDIELSAFDEISDDLDVAGFNIEEYNFAECGIGEDPGEPPAGDSASDSAGDSIGEDPATDLEFDGTLREQIEQSFVDAGFTDDEATCVMDNFDFTDQEALADPTNILGVFRDCDIPLDRLGSLGS